MCAFRFTLSGCVQVLGCACFIIMSPLCLANSDADPWEGINRPIFAFNDALDTYALKPLAQGYQFITPGVVQESIHNVFNNLGGQNLANDVLQVKFHSAGVDTSRFLLNSTIGLVGLIDVATPMGLQRSDEDFGQTLGYWGSTAGLTWCCRSWDQAHCAMRQPSFPTPTPIRFATSATCLRVIACTAWA